MNNLFLQFGLSSWKPLFTALLLPPVPFLLLLVIGIGMLRQRRNLGRLLVSASVALLWLSCCIAASERLAVALLHLPAALTPAQINSFRAHSNEAVAIIVLGGGVEDWAPEYGSSSLSFYSLARLRYGVWLSRKTGWPVGFSGGVGWGQTVQGQTAEATVAQQIATQEFGRPLRWVEAGSRDTRENAMNTVAMLKPLGVNHILLVTHAWHMSRALRNFESAAKGSIRIEAAPIGLARQNELPLLRWMPSGEGLTNMRQVWREWLGQLAGA